MAYTTAVSRARLEEPGLFWSTFWSTSEAVGDWRMAPSGDAQTPGGLNASQQLASAVIISLFTDRLAPEGWRPEVEDRRGWWGDGVAPEGYEPEPLGSWLWTLKNEVVTERVAGLARLYAEQALAWMLRDRVAASVTVTTGLIEDPRRGVWMDIKIAGRDGALAYDRRFARLWRLV